MNDQTKAPKDKSETKPDRDARLNAALRDNLMRRKAAKKAASVPKDETSSD
ncbi:MAG: hypothetical protein QM645_07095 [Asticcacaulis sp.]